MDNKVLLAHGSGGKMSHRLITEVFVKALDNPLLDQLTDAAVFEADGRMAFTTDGYVVNPVFFPGGDIGRLAVCGTVNDLSMMGARPLYLSLGAIIEEGFLLEDLKRIVESIRLAAAEAGISIVTGDTKVVNHGAADGIFLTTAGVGIVPAGRQLSASRVKSGDKVIVSGSIGDHGMAVMSQREGLSFETTLESDSAPLNGLVEAIFSSGANVKWMRDPTRGGVASSLNELAQDSGLGVHLTETDIPIHQPVQAACEMLGLDPLYVANEGKLIAVVNPESADAALAAMTSHKYGIEAAIIGEMSEKPAGRVILHTPLGTTRIVDMLTGEMLPRIC